MSNSLDALDKSILSLMGDCDSSWENNWSADGLEYYCEIREIDTGNVWICLEPITLESYEALELTDKGLEKVGAGRSYQDVAYFRGPPGPAPGPLKTMRVMADSGTKRHEYIFSYNARPIEFRPYGLGVMKMSVDKQHTVLFKAGRIIDVLTDRDGNDFVASGTDLYEFGPKGMLVSLVKATLSMLERIVKMLQPHRAASHSGHNMLLPNGWSIRQITLMKDLVLHVPNPSTVYFFYLANIIVHGPLELTYKSD